jgi:biopolymer transport protein ExbD
MSQKHLTRSSISKLQTQSLTSDINVTPLVDVCLVLLIIFMVVTPMLQKGIPVNLPVTEDPEKTPDTDKQLQISVKDDGTWRNYRAYNKSGTGYLNRNELNVVVADLKASLRVHYPDIFAAVDTDGDEAITGAELRAYLKKR